jgi:hypothetical protein
LFENPTSRPRFWVDEGDGDVAIRQHGPARFTLRVTARTPVRISSGQGAGPGWKVSRGERVRGTFIGFRLPAGTHQVDVTYRPWSFWGSVPFAVATALFLVFWRTPKVVE